MRTNWRHGILKEITKNTKPIIIVSDPDHLLGDQQIQIRLEKEGYISYKYTDHILFRYIFETQYREQLSKQNIRLIIITETPEPNLQQQIPYDFYIKSDITCVSLKKLFPKLEEEALKEISTSQLDRLYSVYQNYSGENIGNRQTSNFILQTLFGIDPQSIISQTDYIISISNKELPENLLRYLNTELMKNQYSPTELFDTEKKIDEYLGKIWSNLVDNQSYSTTEIDTQRLRSVLFEFLLSGRINPIPVSDPVSYPSWMRIGLLDGSGATARQQIRSFFKRLESNLSSSDAPHRKWKSVADTWAQIIALRCEAQNLPEEINEKILKYRREIEQTFPMWILENHQSLYLIRERTPLTLSQVTDHLQRNYPDDKIALLVIDGLSIDQWIKLKQCLTKYTTLCLRFEESLVYAAIPTITSVSRQTIASGAPPIFFENESQAFNKEESFWASNWNKKNKSSAYKRGLMLMKENELTDVSIIIGKDALLLITTYLDEKIHESKKGKHQIHSEIEYWVQNGILVKLIQLLSDKGYQIFITSDHGNVESIGLGQTKQGLLSEKESSRVRIYKEKVFAEQGRVSYPESILYPDKPDQSHYFLYAPDCKSFNREGLEQVTHGGLSIEEVIVPFGRIMLDEA